MTRTMVISLIVACLCGSVCSAKTLIPLPGEVAILPDFPTISAGAYYDWGLQNWDTALTTEFARYKFLFGMAGWTISKSRWVLGAGVDIKEALNSAKDIGLMSSNILENQPITVKFFMTYGLDSDLQKRSWTAGIGCDLIDLRNK